MDVGTAILLMLLALALIGAVKAWRLRHEWAAFQAWRAAGMPEPAAAPVAAATPAPALAFDPTVLPGAGHALKNPPASVDAMLADMAHRHGPPAPLGYRFPLGWTAGGLNTARFVGDVNHILITGQNDAGKDNAVMGMLLALAMQHGPDQLQVAVIDGKGIDWSGWKHKAHCWLLADEPDQIKPAMERISAERTRRRGVLVAAGGAAGGVKWDEYQGGDLPLLVVFISELSLLESATSKAHVADWLNVETAAGRAFGIRYIVATQNVANFDTRWRSQIGLYLAGFQPSRDGDKPNTNLTTAELIELGAIPPSQIPNPPAGAGVFTAIQGRDGVTVRASLIPSQHRAWVLSQLPDRAPAARPASPPAGPSGGPAADLATLQALLQTGQPLPLEGAPAAVSIAAATGHQNATEAPQLVAIAPRSNSTAASVTPAPVALPVAPDLVPADEQRRILAAAAEARSRSDLCKRLYEVRGGTKYTWVQLVCDAAGLLPTGGVA